MVERIVRISEAVPKDVELGFHMCYGDLGGHHLQEPDDTRALVDLMNPVFEQLSRPVQWWHFPSPIERDDEEYFAPLRDLRLPAGTEVYAGVVHLGDGVEGARRRLNAAQTAIDTFGVATECGMGRRPAEQVKSLLEIHAELSGEGNSEQKIQTLERG
jgi:methionine synthase II (cobalamin-independent)